MKERSSELGIVLASVALVVAIFRPLPANVATADVVNALAILSGGVAFAVGSYFALLGVNAFGQIREIESLHAQSSKAAENLEYMLRHAAEFLDDEIAMRAFSEASYSSEARDDAGTESAAQRRRSLLQHRARLARIQQLSESRRITLLFELAEVGNEEDSSWLDRIANDDRESDVVRGIARTVSAKLHR